MDRRGEFVLSNGSRAEDAVFQAAKDAGLDVVKSDKGSIADVDFRLDLVIGDRSARVIWLVQVKHRGTIDGRPPRPPNWCVEELFGSRRIPGWRVHRKVVIVLGPSRGDVDPAELRQELRRPVQVVTVYAR